MGKCAIDSKLELEPELEPELELELASLHTCRVASLIGDEGMFPHTQQQLTARCPLPPPPTQQQLLSITRRGEHHGMCSGEMYDRAGCAVGPNALKVWEEGALCMES